MSPEEDFYVGSTSIYVIVYGLIPEFQFRPWLCCYNYAVAIAHKLASTNDVAVKARDARAKIDGQQ